MNDLSDAMPHLPFPHSSQVDGELRELRCHMGSEHYRVLYRRSERLIVLLHMFRKTTGKPIPTSTCPMVEQIAAGAVSTDEIVAWLEARTAPSD